MTFDLELVLLKKEEIPITKDFRFRIPIHPVLLSTEIKLDPHLANKVFPYAANEFVVDMKKYFEMNKTKGLEKHLRRYIARKPVVKNKGRFGSQKYFGYEDCVIPHENGNGFARALDIDGYRNVVIEEVSYNLWVGFSEEKFKAYAKPEFQGKLSGFGPAYVPDNNVGTIDAALFLRAWGIIYLNEALKHAAKQI
jgi:hypothetical protein